MASYDAVASYDTVASCDTVASYDACGRQAGRTRLQLPIAHIQCGQGKKYISKYITTALSGTMYLNQHKWENGAKIVLYSNNCKITLFFTIYDKQFSFYRNHRINLNNRTISRIISELNRLVTKLGPKVKRCRLWQNWTVEFFSKYENLGI